MDNIAWAERQYQKKLRHAQHYSMGVMNVFPMSYHFYFYYCVGREVIEIWCRTPKHRLEYYDIGRTLGMDGVEPWPL